MALADNVKMFPGTTVGDYDAKIILEACARRDITDVVVIGWDSDGDFVFTSSMAAGPECLWLLEVAKAKLIKKTVDSDGD